jgi:hypothetical protein
MCRGLLVLRRGRLVGAVEIWVEIHWYAGHESYQAESLSVARRFKLWDLLEVVVMKEALLQAVARTVV